MALSGEFGDVREAMQWFHMAANKGDSVAPATRKLRKTFDQGSAVNANRFCRSE
jgi:hypothetical protein